MATKFLTVAALTFASTILITAAAGEAQERAQAVNSAADVQQRLVEERAIEAVIWGNANCQPGRTAPSVPPRCRSEGQ